MSIKTNHLQFLHLLANLYHGENCNNIQINSFGQIFIKLYGSSTVKNNSDFFYQLPKRGADNCLNRTSS